LSYKRVSVRVAAATASAMILRVVVMSAVNYATLRYSPPIGYNTPEAGIIAILPLIGIFNATLVLYTVPVAYLIKNIVKRTIGFHFHSIP